MSSAGFFEADDIKSGGILFLQVTGFVGESGINFYKSFARHLKKIKFPLDIFENI